MDFPARLKLFIKETGLKRDEFAKKTGKSRGQLFKYLGGESSPTTDFFQEIKKAFPWANIDWLITGEGEMDTDRSTSRSFIASGNGHIQIGGRVQGQGIVFNNGSNGNSRINEGAKNTWSGDARPVGEELEEVYKLLADYGTPKLIEEIKQRLLKIKNAME